MRYLGKQSIFDDLMIGGVLLTPPDPATYSYELTLPNDDGTPGQVLTTDGNGTLTWTTTAGSGVTMTDGVDNRIMTASGAQSIQGEAYATFVNTGNISTLSLLSNQDTADLFSISTTTNGDTTITTVNDGANKDADLTFNIDGSCEIATVANKNITLDSGASVYLEGAIIQAEYSTAGVRIRNASASASYYSQINVTGIDGSRTHTLPNASGTLALTSDIPALSVPVTVPQGGTGLTLVASDSILTGNGTSNLVAEPLFKYSADTLLSLGANSSTAMKIHKNNTLSADGGDLEVIAGSGGVIGSGSGATDKNGGDLILKSGLATGNAESQIKAYATNGLVSGTSATTDVLAVSMQANQPGDYPFTLKGQIKIHSSNLTDFSGAALDDYISLYCLYAGQSYIRTKDSQGANNAQLNIIPEGNLYMYTPSGKNMNLDSGDSIILNADNGTISFMDASAILGKITTNGLDLTDNTGAGVIFEGATDNAHQTTLGVIDPTGTRSINLPDADGTVALTTDIPDETTANGQTFVLKTAKVTITQAQFNSLHTTPIDLIAAPGANKQIVPVSGTFAVDRLTTQANGSADLNIHYDLGGSVGSYFTNSYMHIRRFMWNKSTDITYNLAPFSLEIAQSKTVFQNKKLQISVDSILQDSGGTQNCIGDSDIYISYYILDMS